MKRIGCLIFLICCLMLNGCNNDEKLAKETYELLNETCEHINMYVTDQFNLSCSIHDDFLISTDNLYANKTEIAKAYVLFSEKYLDDIKVDDDFNLDEQYDLFINTINSVRKTNLDFAFLGGEQIIQIVYKENGSINTIKTNLEKTKRNLNKISSDQKYYVGLKNYYTNIDVLFKIADTISGGIYHQGDSIVEGLKEILRLQSELNIYFVE